MRLFPRLSLAFVVTGLVTVLVFGAFVVRQVRQQAEASALLALEQEAQLRGSSLDAWVETQKRFLEGWARPYSDRLTTMDPSLQTGLLNLVYVGMPSAMVVALVDADGVAVASPAFADEALARTLAHGQRAEMLVRRAPIKAAETDDAAVGAPYLAPGGTTLSVPLAALATDEAPDSGDELYIVAEVRLDELAELRNATNDDHAIALIDAGGEVLYGADHPLVDAKLLGALAQLVGVVGNFRLPEAGVIGGLYTLPGTNWTLVVLQPGDVAAAAGDRVLRPARVFLFFSLSLSVFLGWVLSYTLTSPVLALRDSVLAVSEGEFGLRAEIDSRDEIGDLARAFNHMSARLLVNQREIEEQHDQIVGFNEELKERVERRTRQLLEAQDQLVRSGQLAAVAEVGAGLAHELNNPLAAILGSAQLLKARSSDPGQVQLVETLEEQAQRCREVVGAMVRFSSGEEVDPDKAPVVDLREVLGDVLTLVQGPFRQRGVDLQLQMPEAPLPVRVDPVHGSRILAQVLNGLRAGLANGTRLDVSAHDDGEDVVVVLSPDLPVAVDEFRRDDWMASGMGLWVARRLLDQLGGRLEQPVKVPWVSGIRPPATEEADLEDPSVPLLTDATWRVFLPRA